MKELYKDTNHMGTMKVLEQGDVRYLEVNGGCQGAYHVKNKYPLSRYVYNMQDMFRMYTVHSDREVESNILIIGAGAMLLPTLLKGRDKITVVDIDPRVFQICKSHFDYDCVGSNNFIVADGFDFLLGTLESYDYIFLDAYLGYDEDGKLYSREGVKLIKSRLTTNGALIYNLITKPGFSNFNLYHQDCLENFNEAKVDFLKSGIKGLRNVVGMCYGK